MKARRYHLETCEKVHTSDEGVVRLPLCLYRCLQIGTMKIRENFIEIQVSQNKGPPDRH